MAAFAESCTEEENQKAQKSSNEQFTSIICTTLRLDLRLRLHAIASLRLSFFFGWLAPHLK